MVFSLSFVEAVQIRGGWSISACGFGPGGAFGPGLQIKGGSKSAAHREITFELTRATVKAFLSDIISLLHRIENFSIKKTK